MGEPIQQERDFVTFSMVFRGETKKVIVSLLSMEFDGFREKLTSLSYCKYGYEVHPEGFVNGDYKLPVIVVNGERYPIE